MSQATDTIMKHTPILHARSGSLVLLPLAAALLANACTPTVQVATPTEPITINLNVRIEHEIRVRVEEELDDIFTPDSGLF